MAEQIAIAYLLASGTVLVITISIHSFRWLDRILT